MKAILKEIQFLERIAESRGRGSNKVYTQDQLDSLPESQLEMIVEGLAQTAVRFNMDSDKVNPFIKSALKFYNLKEGLMIRRAHDGVNEAHWMMQKMIGEYLVDGRAYI